MKKTYLRNIEKRIFFKKGINGKKSNYKIDLIFLASDIIFPEQMTIAKR